jgi:hypothetical protein
VQSTLSSSFTPFLSSPRLADLTLAEPSAKSAAMPLTYAKLRELRLNES